MERVAEILSSIRRQICPRTAYASGGTAAKRLTVVSPKSNTHEGMKILTTFEENVEIQGEFNSFYHVTQATLKDAECAIVPADHVTLLTLLSDDWDYQTSIAFAEKLLQRRHVPLVMLLTPDCFVPYTEGDIAELRKVNRKATRGIGTSFSASIASHRLVSLYNISRVATQAEAQSWESHGKKSPFGHHKQPAVHTRRQFRFLWDEAARKEAQVERDQTEAKRRHSQTTKEADSGKRRVLQRLSDRDCVNRDGGGFIKLSIEQWNTSIQKCLDKGFDDFDIYSHIRSLTLGSSLEADVAVRLEEDKGYCSGDESDDDADDEIFGRKAREEVERLAKAAESEAEAGRAEFMVKMTLECVPDYQRARISSFLDYGCAEGAITATMGSALELPTSRVFGADVRAIPSDGFTFVQLPAEASHAPNIGEILPDTKDNSISLVASAMVLHHVRHPISVLQELRRIVKPTGCLVLREHHCDSTEMAAFLDITHGLYSLAWSKPVEWPNFLDEYEAWYRPQKEWDMLAQAVGFTRVTEIPKIQRQYEVRSNMKGDGRIGNLIKAYYATYLPTTGYVLPSKSPVLSKPKGASIIASLYGGSESTTTTATSGMRFAASSSSTVGGDGDGDGGGDGDSCKQSFAASESSLAESQLSSRKRSMEEANLDSDISVQGSAKQPRTGPMVSDGAAAIVYESRSNRGHFYYQNSESKVEWVSLVHVRDATPVEASQHPTQAKEVGFFQKNIIRRVSKIVYI